MIEKHINNLSSLLASQELLLKEMREMLSAMNA